MAQFEIRDIAPEFGAEIVGFEPAELDPEDRDLLRRTFDERGCWCSVISTSIATTRPT